MLFIENISVQGANCQAGFFSFGFPGLPAFNGLAHVIAARLAEVSGDTVRLKRFAIVHHDGGPRTFGKYNTPSRKNVTAYGILGKGKAGQPLHEASAETYAEIANPSGMPMPVGDFVFSLLLDLDGGQEFLKSLANDPEGLSLDIVPATALGGTVVVFGRSAYRTDVAAAIAKMTSGWILADRTKEVVDAGMPGADALDRLIAAMSPIWRRGSRRLLAPLQIGWRAVGDQVQLAAQREPNVPHYFVEPVIGLAEFEPKHRFGKVGVQDACFWVPTIDAETGYFTCQSA